MRVGFVIYATCTALMYVTGWAAAHTTVATECERLGAFYVNEKTFECKLKGARP